MQGGREGEEQCGERVSSLEVGRVGGPLREGIKKEEKEKQKKKYLHMWKHRSSAPTGPPPKRGKFAQL